MNYLAKPKFFDDEINDYEFSYIIPDLTYSKILSDSSWELNIIEKFANSIFPIKIECPDFPPLQLRFSPKVLLTSGLTIGYEEEIDSSSSTLSYDLYGELKLGGKIELGFYFNISIDNLDIAVGLDGNLYEGKVGFKLSIDFIEVKANILFYYYYYKASLYFYIYIKSRVLSYQMDEPLPYNYSIYAPSFEDENEKIYKLYDDNGNTNNSL